MTKEKARVILLGGVVAILALCAWFIWSMMGLSNYLHEEMPPVDPRGILKPGISSGKQTIDVPYKRHLYEFSGEANQTIEINAHPYSEVYISIYISAKGYSENADGGN